MGRARGARPRTVRGHAFNAHRRTAAHADAYRAIEIAHQAERWSELKREWRRGKWRARRSGLFWLLVAAIACSYTLAAFYGTGSWTARLLDALKLFPSGFPGYERKPWQFVVASQAAAAISLALTFSLIFVLLGQAASRTRARTRRRHVLICGLGETGLRSLRAFRAAGIPVTCVDRDATHAEEVQARRGVFLAADATDIAVLQIARAARADHVVCACGTDASNIAIAAGVAALATAERGGNAPVIHVRLRSRELASALRGRLANVGPVRLGFFDATAVWARALLDHAESPFSRISARPPQIWVLGDSDLTSAVCVEAARRWHRYARANGVGLRARIVMQSTLARQELQLATATYPALGRTCDLEAIDRPAVAVEPLPPMAEAERTRIDAFFICLLDGEALALALETSKQLAGSLPVLIPAAAAAEAVAPLLPRLSNVHAVGPQAQEGALDLLHDDMRDLLARQVHEAYLQQREGEPDFGTRPADRSWTALDAGMIRANRRHVDAMIEQLHAVWYELELRCDWDSPIPPLDEGAIEAMAELEHQRWLREHPHGRGSMWHRSPTDRTTSWNQLPESERRLTKTLVRERPALAAAAGFHLVRSPAREQLARLLHQEYVQRASHDRSPTPSWQELSEAVREYNRSNVDHIALKLAHIGRKAVPESLDPRRRAEPFRDDEIEEMATLEHQRWVGERLQSGWRPGASDEAGRTHPALVPWAELPEIEREKDRQLVRAIPSLLRAVGYAVVDA